MKLKGKPKLQQYYEGKDKEIDIKRWDVMPFPGNSLLRWVIFTDGYAVKYEGKLSFQALDGIWRYYKKCRKPLYLVEFDRGGVILRMTFWGRRFEFIRANLPLWEKYHGKIRATEYYEGLWRRHVAIPKNA